MTKHCVILAWSSFGPSPEERGGVPTGARRGASRLGAAFGLTHNMNTKIIDQSAQDHSDAANATIARTDFKVATLTILSTEDLALVGGGRKVNEYEGQARRSPLGQTPGPRGPAGP